MDVSALVSAGPTCQKLQSFITKIRSCKSPAEETVVIEKECANIRTTLKEDHYRHRNIAKLMFIDLMGHSVKFGQMDCLKLLASNYFFEKRIGYLAVPVLLDTSTDILMLATNTIKNDILSGNQYVAGAALTCLANTGTPEMVDTLQGEILHEVSNTNPTLKKKYLVLAAKLVRQQPHLATRFCKDVITNLRERNHGLIISALALLNAILPAGEAGYDKRCATEPEDPFTEVPDNASRSELAKMAAECSNILINLERDLISASPALIGSSSINRVGHNQYGIKPGAISSAEFDYQGLCDPFLQCKLLQSLRAIVRLYPDKAFMPVIVELLHALLISHDNYKSSALSIVIDAIKLACALLEAAGPAAPASKATGSLLEVEVSSPETIDPPAPAWAQSLKASVQEWITQLLRHRDSTIKITACNIVLGLSPGFCKVDLLKDIALEMLSHDDRVVQMKAVSMIRHISERRLAVEMTDQLLNFLLVISDPVPTAKLKEQPLGKDVQFSGKTAVVVQDSTFSSSTSKQFNVVQSRLLDITIDTLETLISSYAETESWKIVSLIRLIKLVGNKLTDRSRVHMNHVFLQFTKRKELYQLICGHLVNGLKDNIYNAPMASLVVSILSCAREDMFERGEMILNILETIMTTYGYGLAQANVGKRCNYLALYDDGNSFAGVFSPIGLKGICTYPSSSLHVFHNENLIAEHPQVLLPEEAATVAQRAQLKESIVLCLAKTAALFPSCSERARKLMETILKRNTDPFAADVIDSYIAALSSEKGAQLWQESRLMGECEPVDPLPLGQIEMIPPLTWDRVESYTINRRTTELLDNAPGGPITNDDKELSGLITTTSKVSEPKNLLDDFLL